MENLTLFDSKPDKKYSIYDRFKTTCPLCGASKKQRQNCKPQERKNNTSRFPVCYDKPFYYHQQRLTKESK